MSRISAAHLGVRKTRGWFDSVGLMNGFRRGARSNGAEYVENEVVGLSMNGDKIEGVTLATGETVSCGTLINAAGPRASVIASLAGISIPVEPRKRHSFVFSSDKPVPGKMPNVIDMTGAYVRPEHNWFLTGNTPTPDLKSAVDDFETKHDEFMEYIWPALYHRNSRIRCAEGRAVLDRSLCLQHTGSERDYRPPPPPPPPPTFASEEPVFRERGFRDMVCNRLRQSDEASAN